MARTRTLAQIRASARQLADQAGTSRNTDANLDYQIDQFVAHLWGKLVKANPDRYLTTGTISTTAGTTEYNLPSDFMSMRRVARAIGTREMAVFPFGLQEADDYQDYPGFDAVGSVRYRIMGQGHDGTAAQIWFRPDPGTHTYNIYYVQNPELFSGDSDIFDGVAGWESWVEHRLAIWMKERDEEDTSGLRADLAAIERDISVLGAQLDSGKPPRIRDVRRTRRRHWRRAR